MHLDFAFLDSGTGGLPYMGYLKSACPEASCLYLADTKNFPYGEKTPEQVIAATREAVELVLSRFSPAAFVLACNTMSVTALESLRQDFPKIHFIGTVPAIKVAAAKTRNNTIGLLATEATLRHPYTQRLIHDFASSCRVVSRGDGKLIRFIEQHLLCQDRNLYLEVAHPAVDFFLEQNVDTIVLGCTHFLHIAAEIQQLAGEGVQVVDSREGVIRQALRIRSHQGHAIQALGKDAGPRHEGFFVTELSSPEIRSYYQELCAQFFIPWCGLLK